jgi:hypothetical protein
MMKKNLFGSEAWIEDVFSDGNSRNVAGRSRPTQRYGISVANNINYAEGGNESTARIWMQLGQNTRKIGRWKVQPFGLTKESHGVEAYPDLIFETTEKATYVVEVRSARFQTQEKLDKAMAIESAINATGTMKYLYWTDAWPLHSSATALARELRRCGTSEVPHQKLYALQEMVKSRPYSFQELRKLNFFRDDVMAGVWQGFAHINLFALPTDETMVTSSERNRGFKEVLSAPVGAQTWWNSLNLGI